MWDMVSISETLMSACQLQQCHLCFLMKITWQDTGPQHRGPFPSWNACSLTMVMSAQLCWAGHIARMPDERLPKDIMYGQPSSGTDKQRGQQLWYKDTLHRSLAKANIAPSTWEDLAQDHTVEECHQKRCRSCWERLKEASEEKHRKWCNRPPAIVAPPGLTCQVYDKQCQSRISLYSRSKTHCSNPTWTEPSSSYEMDSKGASKEVCSIWIFVWTVTTLTI